MVMMVMMVREFYRIRIPIQEPQLIICFYWGSVIAHYNLSRLKTAFVSLSPASLPKWERGVDGVPETSWRVTCGRSLPAAGNVKIALGTAVGPRAARLGQGREAM
jgi:hypothetical protein